MGKLGRGGSGGGRVGGKRSLPPPPPPAHIQRVGPSSAAARLPLSCSAGAASRGRHSVGPGPGSAVCAAVSEETFSMVSADTLDFAAVIRLTPDLVDEIKRLEAQGGAAKIKFDSNSCNLSGNVIDVGGKEFKFTWSRELGVCDIYEELQGGEDGKGLLSERGSAWRKLNIQRMLDESLKHQVKMRSEEAERQLKSRKSIVLDPANPSVKNQAKAMTAAAVEGNMRRAHWKKDQVLKKRKSEPRVVTTKPVLKSGMPTNNSTGAMLSISPQPSPPEQVRLGASVSPFGISNPSRGHTTMAEDFPGTSNEVDVTNSEKELSNKPAHGTICRLVGNKGASSLQPVDLRNLLVNLLVDNPKGMSLKALEKAVGEAIPNSGKKMENIIKTIATYQAPGRYILKPGVEVECSGKPPSESGSSPEHPLGSVPATEVVEKDNTESEDNERKTQSKQVESDIIEKIDVEQNSPDLSMVDRKVNNEDEEGACSSSGSGSDTDSESDTSDSESDSGSQSRSRSKSQSPVGSGSASSSDSESDGSSSSREGSDVDVDIMTSDDDKEETGDKLPTSARLFSSPKEMRLSDERLEENAIGRGNLDSQRTSPQMDSHDYVSGGNALAHENTEGKFKEARVKAHEISETLTTKSIVSDDFHINGQVFGEGMASQDQYQQPVLQSISSARKSTMDKIEHVERPSSYDKQLSGNCPDLTRIDGMHKISKAKPKRASDSRHFQEKPESSKKSRAANTGVKASSGKSRDNSFPETSCTGSPDRTETVEYGGQMTLIYGDVDRDQNRFNLLNDPDSALTGRYMVHENADRFRLNPDVHNATSTISDARQLGQRAGDTIVRGTKAFGSAEQSGRHIDNSNRAAKRLEKSYRHPDDSDTSGVRSMHLQDKFLMSKDKMYKDVRDVVADINENFSVKNHDDSGEDKPSSLPDSHYGRSGDQNGIQKDAKVSLNMLKAEMDKCTVTSDLESGEFREPPSVDDTKGGRIQFERKNSFKSSDSKLNVMDNFSSDSNKGRTPVKATHVSKRQSPYMLKCGSQANQDGSYRRMSEGDIMESTTLHQTTMPSQVQQFSRVDRPQHNPISHVDRLSDTAGRIETRTSQGIGQENHVSSHRKASASVLAQHETKHNGLTCQTAMDAKPQKYNGVRDMSDRSKENFRAESIANSVKRMDSSSDEDDSFYAKYDKSEPELRGPIKDYAQYKEYVQEYHEKFDCYSNLNRHLEEYRNEFLKVGRDLEVSKGRDKKVYCHISEQIMQMYYQCGKKHSQMKKIFVVLHEELMILKKRIKDFAEEYTRD